MLSSELVLEYGVTDPLTVEDEFWLGQQEYGEYARYLPALGLLALALDACRGAAGVPVPRRRLAAGADRPVRGGFDRMPLDALAFCAVLVIVLLIGGRGLHHLRHQQHGLSPELVVGLGLISCGCALCLLALCLTARRAGQDPHPPASTVVAGWAG